MKKILTITTFLFSLVLTNSLLFSGDKDNDQESHFRLLATTRTSTMQKEMTEAAQNGYKVRTGAPTAGTEMVILMEKHEMLQDIYQYKLLATRKTSTMDKELNEAGDEGFRLLPQTMIAKKGSGFSLSGSVVEVVVVMEKEPNTTSRFQYKLLATSRTSTLEKEVLETEAAGFSLVGMVSRGEHMVIMEKELK